MATNGLDKVVQHLKSIAFRQEAARMTDKQLLDCYLAKRDEAAFAVLVRRHGPLVWNVCRRILPSHHDAEDAFQATFLVLVRKASSIVSRELLANWLYGVAHRTALKARAALGRRQARERQVVDMPEAQGAEPDLWSNLLPVLDQELTRIPEKYRAAIVLCDLEGKTRKEAARLLRLPEGTVASRLTRGRAMLATRLGRHGLAVSGGTLAAVVAQNAASACVPASVVWGTIKAATLLAAGKAAAAGAMSAKVAALTEGVVRAMFLTKLKTTMVALLVGVSAIGIGGGLLRYGLAAGRASIEGEGTGQQTAKVAESPRQNKSGSPNRGVAQSAKPGESEPKILDQRSEEKLPTRQTLLNLLDQRIEMKLLQQLPMALKEALSALNAKEIIGDGGKELPILVDEEVFKAENPDAPDIYETKIQFPPYPRVMTRAGALAFLLSKVDTKNATYVVLPDHILITTYDNTSPEAKLSAKVRGEFEKRPLHSVLRELSDTAGATIIIDNRAADKAKTEVSATFHNDIDLAGALRVLTEMADLKVLVLDGAIFVTTQTHADALRNELRGRLAAQKEMGLKVDPLWPYQPGSRPKKVDVAQLIDEQPRAKAAKMVTGVLNKRPLNSVLLNDVGPGLGGPGGTDLPPRLDE